MKDPEPNQPEIEDITGLHLLRLLPLGMTEKRQPIDELVERLQQKDGADWLSSRLQEVLGEDSPEEVLASDQASLDDLVRLKNQGNDGIKKAASRDALLSGMALYFLSIAAALAQHGELISSQPREAIDPLLLRLGAAVPSPWTEVIEAAVRRPA